MRTCIRFAALAVVTAMLLLASFPANAASPAEALEKGIYNEETTGNLDEAIKLYRQVLSDAQKTEGLAAQAQYRLGRCLDKLGKKAEAAEAFKTLIRKYPDQKELVAKTKKMLPGRLELLPAPWKSGERTTLTMMLPGGRAIAIIGSTVTAGKRDGKAVWEIGIRRYVTGGQNSGVSSVVIDQKTNLPLTTDWDHTILGHSTAKWSADKVVITKKTKDGKDETKTVQFEAPAYCNDQWMFGLRQLPLKIGYKVTVPIRVSFTGGNGIGMEVDVTTKEKVETPVGTFDCFKVETNIAQTFWIADTPERYIAKLTGGGVEMLLTSIDSGKPAKLSNDKLNFSVTKPAGWFHYASKSQNEATSGRFDFVAPTEFLSASLKVRKKTLLSSEERESADAWADSIVQSAKDSIKDASVGADTRKAIQFAGQKGVTFVLDYEASGRKRRSSPTLAFKDDISVQLEVSGDVKPFTEHQKTFESIRKSVTVE
jgi:hypothetical protein